MSDISFDGLLVVSAIALAAPLLTATVPGLRRIPAVVVEILAGIAVGPSGFGWVHADGPISVLALVGLAFLLFLAGLEIDPARLRGPVLRSAGLGYLVTLGLGLAVGFAAAGAGIVRSPLLVAVTLSATSLGLVVPVLKDSGQADTDLGRLTIAGATVADFSAIVLLSLFFSTGGHSGARGPLILLAFLVVRGVPAALYAPAVGRRAAVAAGLLQATTLPFVVTATAIGVALHLMTAVTAAALVAAGLVSVVVFPLLALGLLRT